MPRGTEETRVREGSGRRTSLCLDLSSVTKFLSSGFAALLLSLDVLRVSYLARCVEIGAEFASLENTVSVLSELRVPVAAVLGTECSVLNGQVFL